MIQVANINVSTLSRESLTISWTIVNTTENLDNYTLSVHRSLGQSGPYQRVSSEFLAGNAYQFVDNGVNLFSKNREYYYRIRALNTTTNETLFFGSTPPEDVIKGENPRGAFLESPPDIQALEAIRRNDLLLREFIGRKVLFLKRKDTGSRCTTCWDAIKRRRTQSNCINCYDTGISGGYYNAQETFCAKAPERNSTALTPIFELQPGDLLLTFSSFPRVFPRDLIIADDRRFRVLGVQKAEKLWSVTHQTVQVRELSKDQVEYRLDITAWGKNTFTASPKRQYINATDVESYANAVQKLGIEE